MPSTAFSARDYTTCAAAASNYMFDRDLKESLSPKGPPPPPALSDNGVTDSDPGVGEWDSDTDESWDSDTEYRIDEPLTHLLLGLDDDARDDSGRYGCKPRGWTEEDSPYWTTDIELEDDESEDDESEDGEYEDNESDEEEDAMEATLMGNAMEVDEPHDPQEGAMGLDDDLYEASVAGDDAGGDEADGEDSDGEDSEGEDSDGEDSDGEDSDGEGSDGGDSVSNDDDSNEGDPQTAPIPRDVKPVVYPVDPGTPSTSDSEKPNGDKRLVIRASIPQFRDFPQIIRAAKRFGGASDQIFIVDVLPGRRTKDDQDLSAFSFAQWGELVTKARRAERGQPRASHISKLPGDPQVTGRPDIVPRKIVQVAATEEGYIERQSLRRERPGNYLISQLLVGRRYWITLDTSSPWSMSKANAVLQVSNLVRERQGTVPNGSPLDERFPRCFDEEILEDFPHRVTVQRRGEVVVIPPGVFYQSVTFDRSVSEWRTWSEPPQPEQPMATAQGRAETRPERNVLHDAALSKQFHEKMSLETSRPTVSGPAAWGSGYVPQNKVSGNKRARDDSDVEMQDAPPTKRARPLLNKPSPHKAGAGADMTLARASVSVNSDPGTCEWYLSDETDCWTYDSLPLTDGHGKSLWTCREEMKLVQEWPGRQNITGTIVAKPASGSSF